MNRHGISASSVVLPGWLKAALGFSCSVGVIIPRIVDSRVLYQPDQSSRRCHDSVCAAAGTCRSLLRAYGTPPVANLLPKRLLKEPGATAEQVLGMAVGDDVGVLVHQGEVLSDVRFVGVEGDDPRPSQLAAGFSTIPRESST